MSRFFTALAALLFALALLFFPQAGAEAARSGLLLCGETILPALFPYFVMSNLLIYGGLGARLSRVLQPIMSPLFHVGGSGGAALALGLAGGYPTGAATVRSLLEQCACTLEEAQSLLHTPVPPLSSPWQAPPSLGEWTWVCSSLPPIRWGRWGQVCSSGGPHSLPI